MLGRPKSLLPFPKFPVQYFLILAFPFCGLLFPASSLSVPSLSSLLHLVTLPLPCSVPNVSPWGNLSKTKSYFADTILSGNILINWHSRKIILQKIDATLQLPYCASKSHLIYLTVQNIGTFLSQIF